MSDYRSDLGLEGDLSANGAPAGRARRPVEKVIGKVEAVVERTVGESAARKVRDQAEAVVDRAETAYANARTRMDREIALQPYKALAIAAGAGLLVGLLMARRDRTIIYRPVDR